MRERQQYLQALLLVVGFGGFATSILLRLQLLWLGLLLLLKKYLPSHLKSLGEKLKKKSYVPGEHFDAYYQCRRNP